MRYKYKIDRDTRTLILKYIRKYKEYKKWYEEERTAICETAITPKQEDGMPHGSGKSDITGNSAVRLEKLNNSHKAKVVRAIEKSRAAIGKDLFSHKEREYLKRAIWLSCLNAKKYPFEAFAGFVAYERRQFYYYKNKFLNDIKNELDI